ncbi:helix-turn-helix domain-containing protein [Pontibacillus sp. ALD_SL1]|uniref:helix-turn-helix domain-containing protein n=1 Tax=Pontibacillus sp. ALD_SL1 TaxID=2777185 RepID=UPI001A9657D7|nr:helix-turn-helix domain-containing protein [Pontibacillus sp. ALD_SL1]QST00505.1 helix-turn-helix domain-containing protein [Pontibacillus sp. ALD_SL1]
MEMKTDNSLRALFTFYYSTRVPIYFFEYDNQTKTSLGEIPAPLERLHQEERKLIQEQMKEKGRVHHVTDAFHRHFLAINTETFASFPTGYVCIGPFLYNELNNQDIQEAFQRQRESIYVSRKVLAYYSQLPVVHTKQVLYYGQILLALLTTDWDTSILDQTFDQFTFFPKKTEPSQEDTKFLSQAFQLEQEFLHKLRQGDPSAVNDLSHAKYYPTPTYGKDNMVRSYKNRLIATVTLVARAAIEAGVNETESLSISYYYINEIDQKEKVEDLMHLEKVMVHDYLSKIQKQEQLDHSPLMQACLESIQANLHKPITIERMAKELGVRSEHLSNLFRREVGLSLQQYIHRQKMKEVKKALLNQKDSILSVAGQYGYKSASHFSRIFKKYEGISPSNYRKQNGL